VPLQELQLFVLVGVERDDVNAAGQWRDFAFSLTS
jgi:hypothetical protein